MKKIILLSAAAALLAVPAAAQQVRGHFESGAGVTRSQAEARVRDAFARIDTNRDGFVTQAEADAFRSAFRAQRQERRGVNREARFARLDADANGSISPDEFFARQQRGDRAERWEQQAERRAERFERRGERRGPRAGVLGRLSGNLFARIDADRDGRVSLAEATNARLRAFNRADANRDGRVTREERRSLHDERRARRG